MSVLTKRVYEPASAADGYRVLIDRLWPRGVKKADARIDEWAHELAPSDELRRWFGHDPDRFEQFKERYIEELRPQRAHIAELRRRGRRETVTLLFAARDSAHSNAAVLSSIVRRGFPRENS
jgi:uncharacterized protein YeaO (DUF488 family)